MGYLTYFDLVEGMIVSSYGGPQDAEQRDIRTAVLRAYQELTTIHEWSFYSSHGRIITQVPYQTGTVSFVASTRQLTLSGGAWPSWATEGSISVGRLIGKIASVNGQVATLDSVLTFPADFTAQAYVLFRTDYPLPDDFRNMDEPSNEYNWWSGLYLKPDEAMKLERIGNRSGRPWHWTVLKNPNGTGYILKLVGYPTTAETLDFTYRRYPGDLKRSGHEAASRIASISIDEYGIATWSAPSPQAFADWVGLVIRISADSSYPGAVESFTPYAGEGKIESLNAARSVDITGLSATTYSGKAALVTDQVDIARHMENALYSCCDYWLDRIRGTKPDASFATYQRDLRLAMEQDQLAPLSGRTRPIWHDGGWRSPLKPDEGV